MKKYWLLPAIAIIAITTSMVYSMASIEKSKSVDGKVIFIDGTTISNLSYQPTDTEDKHKVVFFKLVPGTQAGLIFAIHLNDSNQKILINAGDFPWQNIARATKFSNADSLSLIKHLNNPRRWALPPMRFPAN